MQNLHPVPIFGAIAESAYSLYSIAEKEYTGWVGGGMCSASDFHVETECFVCFLP